MINDNEGMNNALEYYINGWDEELRYWDEYDYDDGV